MRTFIAISLVAFMCVLFSNSAIAADGLTGSGTSSDGQPGSALKALDKVCGVQLADNQNGEVQLKIFSVGVKCFENVINGLAENTIGNFSRYLSNIVYTLLVLYLIILGLKVSLGSFSGDKLKSEVIMHALKISFVAWLVFAMGGGGFFGIIGVGGENGLVSIYHMVLGSYYSMLNIVLTDANFGECSGATAFSSGGTDAIWQTMDCLLGKFIGFNSQNGYGQSYKGVALLFGLISTKILPANGFIIGGIIFSTLWMLLMSFFRLAFVYILSMIGLIILFSIGPIIVPLMLFERTKSYFENWYKAIIAFVLQPVILFAFFSFIGGMFAEVDKKLAEVLSQLKPTIETSSKTQTGESSSYGSTMVMDAFKNMDKELLLSMVTTLVIAILLTSFINFVGKMAQELAGTAQNPDLFKDAGEGLSSVGAMMK